MSNLLSVLHRQRKSKYRISEYWTSGKSGVGSHLVITSSSPSACIRQTAPDATSLFPRQFVCLVTPPAPHMSFVLVRER